MKNAWRWCVAIAALVALASPGTAWAVCRVVEPLGDSESGVVFDSTTAVLVVQAPDQVVDYHCARDQLRGEDDEPSLREDPAICPDGTPATPEHDSLTHVVVQPTILASGGRAGLVMPLPRRSDVHEAPPEVMAAADAAVPVSLVRETVEFVEDPTLGYQCSDPHYAQATPEGAMPMGLYACGDSGYYRPGLEGTDTSVVEYSDGTVEYESIDVSDDYDVTVLSASSLEALTTWMDERSLAHDEVADAAFARYVGEGRWFVAIEVTPMDLGGEERALAPLVVTWRGADFPLTHELTYDPRGGIVETDLYVMAPTRMALADGDGRTVYAAPFELDPLDAVLGPFGLESGWLTRIHVERRMSDALQRDTELVPAAFEEEVPRIVDRETRVRIAQACCNGSQMPDRDAPHRTFVETREYAPDDPPSDDTLFYSAPEQDPDWCVGGEHYDEPVYDYGYGCTVAGAAFSWSPLLMALWLTWRRRRRSRADR